MPSAAEEQRPALLPLDSPSGTDRTTGIHAQNVGVGGKEVETVKVGAFRSRDSLVNVEPGGQALSGSILRLKAVLVNHGKQTRHDDDHVRAGVHMPTRRLTGRKMEVLKHSVGAVPLIDCPCKRIHG